MNAVYEARLSAIREALPLYEDEKRLEHTLGVYRECVWFSKKFGLSEQDSYTVCAAALLHDITKNLSKEQALSICSRYGIEPPALSAVMHQYTGPLFARELFGNIVREPLFKKSDSRALSKNFSILFIICA
jgi:HD superfamily phosphohydrolase YqeK